MSTSSPPSLSSLFIRLPGTEGKIAANCSSRIFLCSTGSRPRRKSSSSPPSPARLIALPKKLPAADAPPLQPKKRHWSVGEFPGKSDISILRSQRPPIKNVKKKVDRRAAAKAWVCTVTEALADKIQKKQWEQALEVFEMLRKQSFYQPKEGTYMKLLVLLGKSGQAARAVELFETMVEEGIEPTSTLYTALLAAYCRCNLLDESYCILNKMKASPLCQPDIFTYSILLKACVDESRFELIDSLYHEMSERMIVPNTVTQNVVLGAYGKAGKFSEMEKVLSFMLGSDSCKPDVWTMNIILGLFGRMGQIEMMEKWYEKFRGIGIEPETRTFNILIGAYGRKRMYNKMSAVMEYMRKLAFPWTTSTYNNVIEAFANVGDVQNMEHAFDQMQEEGMKTDTNTFSYLISGFSNAGLFHKVVRTIKLAERMEIPANTSFYNAVIQACARAGDIMEMERVFKRMKERQCLPDSLTYSTLVETFRMEGMNDKIYELEQVEGKNFGLDLVK
ncbi:Pentatricopeptide repeat-containing protein [Apostasia shenzhenica]|uniref:Pentatricopeptide repeat-containing protein n=1 Tax=Apostasia shenzhenica TaxID=1088818 RepID=A0A2H9ZY06_9ASPA|nr:Pentatricopeptide repeat-containing protein [Apostasia shenzhenica]